MNVPLRSHSTDALAAQLSRVALAASASTGARAVRQRAVAAASSSRGFSSSSSPASSSTSSSSFQKAGNARTWSAQKCGHGLVPSSRSEVGNGRSRHVGARRNFSSTPATRGFFDRMMAGRLGRLALGNRAERERQRERGGLLPEEARKLEEDRQREAAFGAAAADGSALVEEPDKIPLSAERVRAEARMAAKRAARVERKRWGKDGVLEHKFSTAQFKISPRKLQMLADQIAGQPIDHAILQMQFSSKRAAKRVRATLSLARDHAAAKGLDPRTLVVAEAWVGKGMYLTRVDIKGRGRAGRKDHPSARLSVVLRPGKTWEAKAEERLADARKMAQSVGDGGVVRTNRKIVNAYQRPGWSW